MNSQKINKMLEKYSSIHTYTKFNKYTIILGFKNSKFVFKAIFGLN